MGKKKKKTIHVAPQKKVDPLIDAIMCTKAAMECDNRPTTAGSCLKQASKDEFISPFTGSISPLNEENEENKDEVAKVSKLENYFKEPINVESEEENKVEEKKEEKKQEVKSISLLQKFMKLFGW